MKYKTIEGMRQTRLWITEVILPVTAVVVSVETTHPEFKYKLVDFGKQKYNKIKQKFKRKATNDKSNIHSIDSGVRQ